VAILCNKASPHRTKVVEGFLQDNDDVRIIYLPMGSPYPNPTEAGWMEGRWMLPVSKYCEKVYAFAGTILMYFRTARFRLDLFAYLNRSVEIYLKNL